MLAAMSSSNQHFPPAVKRLASSISSSSAVFPALPGLSFDNVAVFARQVQEALNQTLSSPPVSAKRPKVKTQLDDGGDNVTLLNDPDVSSVSLPLLSPHRLNYRFKVASDKSVFIVTRNPYSVLKKAFIDLDVDAYSGMYLRGPVGVGKSYLLYILAAELRFLRKTYRVTYINDCASWRCDKFGFILRELVMTFFSDGNFDGRSVIEWAELCRASSGSGKKEIMMMMMMEALITYVQIRGLQWVIICDQHNALYARSVVVERFPFNIMDYLAKFRSSNIKVIISASANNEGYPTEMKGWFTHDIASHKFDNVEFATWCDHFQLKNGDFVDPKSDEAIDALYWTGGVPYELSLLWEQPAATVVEKTKEYRKNRITDMRAEHGKFCHKLSSEEMLNLKECIARMALGLTRPDGLEGMDRQLFDIIHVPHEGHPNKFDELIVALNPVARRSLIGYHGQGLLTSLGLVAEIVLKGNYTQDVKGRTAVKYLLTTMEVAKKFSYQHTTKIVGGLSTGTPTRKSIELVEIVPFSGQKLPPLSSLNRKCSTLFIPESVVYPGYDFFIWDSESLELLAFQVTITKPFYKHPKIDSASACQNCNSWSVFCNANAVKVNWVIPKDCVGGPKSKKAVGSNVVLFESLWDDYPVLKHLKIF